MQLEPGTTLGHYEILSSLGAGGMGEVYRARDTKLGREVAIKLLLEEVSADPERLARFEREARVLASLSHNNIAVLYGFEADGDTKFLVMELVEGETLDDRLKRSGAMSLDEALPLFIQIAEGLEAAHEKGIVHRDLKPANVKISSGGALKILDFGLAKAMAPDSGNAADASRSMSPTLTLAATQRGEILGTAAYMSPEQARGDAVDRRTDVWAFGACLYECLSGKKAFDAESAPDSMAKVLQVEPEWQGLPPSTPARVRELLERCLAKNPRDRVHDIADARLELERAMEEPQAAPEAIAVPSGSARLQWAALGLVAGLAIAAAATLAGWWPGGMNSQPSEPLGHRFRVDLPQDHRMPPGMETTLAISPDGQVVAFVANGPEGRQLFLQRLNDLEPPAPVPGTAGAVTPFFSPDSQWLAYGVGFRAARRISLTGEQSLTLCDPCGNPSWAEDGSIVFTWEGSLWRVPEVGDEAEPLVPLLSSHGIWIMDRPILLPGEDALLFQFTGSSSTKGVGLVSIDTDRYLEVTTDGADPLYSPTGHVLFARGDSLFAVPVDLDAFELRGPALPVLEKVRVENGGALQASFSKNGVLAYAPGSIGTQLVWADESGERTSLLEPWRVYQVPRVSPDGTRVSVLVEDGGASDIWTREIERGTLSPLTRLGQVANSIWTRDSARLTFLTGSPGGFRIQFVAADGSGEPETLLESETAVIPEVWAPGDRQLVFRREDPESRLFVLDLDEGREERPLFDGEFDQRTAALSLDGEWLAYVSSRSGTEEVYVRRFRETGVGRQVSSRGGSEPVWGPDGRTLYFRGNDSAGLMAASLRFDPLDADQRILYDGNRFWGWAGYTEWDIDPAGERLLMLDTFDEKAARPKIHVVQNWFEELERLVPTD